jgi:hypothetical protein
MLDTLKSELLNLASSRIAWFLAGVFLSGQDMPSVVASLRTFVGV